MIASEHCHELTWIGPVPGLAANSPIVRSVQAGKIPAVHVIADQLLAGHGQEHLDHKILTIAAVYLVLGDLLLKTDIQRERGFAIPSRKP